jgi:glycerol-3-phosphate dehydrogenase
MGAVVRNHCEVVGVELWEDEVAEVRFRDRRTGNMEVIKPEIVVNATGAWADRIASMAGLNIPLRVDKGSLVVLDGRRTIGLVNRLRPPSDGDIVVPSHSSSIAGTTCMEVSSPDDCRASMDEVRTIMAEAAEMIPSLGKARAVRAYAGIRPLPADSDEGRDISRTFRIIDHSSEGVENMISIVGGKLTTYRLMAEKVSDDVMVRLGRRGTCRTATVEIGAECPSMDLEALHVMNGTRMSAKYGSECVPIAERCTKEPRGREMLCSCERVLRGEASHFASSIDSATLADVLRRTRAGMGYCQSGLCALRSLSVMEETGADPRTLLEEFNKERWKGIGPVLFDVQLRQELFKLYLNSSLSLEGGDDR